jgi:hypothetical protein
MVHHSEAQVIVYEIMIILTLATNRRYYLQTSAISPLVLQIYFGRDHSTLCIPAKASDIHPANVTFYTPDKTRGKKSQDHSQINSHL